MPPGRWDDITMKNWYLDNDDTDRIDTPLLSPASPRELTIPISELDVFYTQRPVNYFIEEKDQAEIRSIVECKEILSNAHTVRVKCVFFDFLGFFQSDYVNPNQTLDLGCFKDLPACIRKFKFEFNIEYDYFGAPDGYWMMWGHVFGAEVRHVAKTFMKEGALTVQIRTTNEGKPESFLLSCLKGGKEV